MTDLRISFATEPTEIVVKKVIVISEKRVKLKVVPKGETEPKVIEFNFENMKDGYRYIFNGHDYLNEAHSHWLGDTVYLGFNVWTDGSPLAHFTEDITSSILHYTAADEAATDEAAGFIHKPIVNVSGHDFAVMMRSRITFTAHHFIRSLPVSLGNLLSKLTDIEIPMRSVSPVEIAAQRRYDTTCNFFRSQIGFLWREVLRHVNHPSGTGQAPVKTQEELISLLESLERSVMGQTAHKELHSHATGAVREDAHVLHFYVDHDENVWNERFQARQIWSAEEKVYDVNAHHEIVSGEVNESAVSEFFDIVVSQFMNAVQSPYRDLGYTLNTLHISEFLPITTNPSLTNASLESLIIKDSDDNIVPFHAPFSPNNFNYIVNNAPATVSYVAVAAYEDATIEYPVTSIPVGTTVLTFTVTAADGVTRSTYNILFVRTE